MSTRFWMGSAGFVGAGAMLGLALGSFVTSAPPRTMPGYAEAISEDMGESAVSASDMADNGPGAIVCKGCGPTLAQRRMAADNPGWDADGMIGGTNDPVVTDYLAREDSPWTTDIPPTDTPPSAAHRLPANVQRFADGEDKTLPVAKPQPVVQPPAIQSPVVLPTSAPPAPPSY